MHLVRFLFLAFLLAVALLAEDAQCKRVICKDSCCSFVESFPVKLRKLRTSYDEMRNYYVNNDDLGFALFNRTVLENLKGPYFCHVMNEVLRFYLDTVLPTAITQETQNFKTSIDYIGNIFNSIKRDIVKCKSYFSCKKPFEISSIQKSYSQMKEKGLYKAMGELDMLFNYIEDYLASKRLKN
ncbi:interleukin-10 [Astyanax mexicanus]|uniref:Interleukin family protein n=1 Tax=Astyanax mexicanus TaxID=7994 RepID=A0A3B1K4Q0_ASTMX|nr:interleukin-10 [Astyanax mexicanus]